MATRSDSPQSPAKEKRKYDDFRESCSLCLEPYIGRTPKLLPCYHTFCLPCLTSLADSVRKKIPRNIPASTRTSDPAETVLEGKEKVSPVGENKIASETQSGSEDLELGDGNGGEGIEKEASDEESVGGKGGCGEVIRCRDNDNAASVFLCPTCRAPVTVPEGGVIALQTNFYIVTDAEESPQPVPCEMCEEEDRKEAQYTCSKCHQSMCRTCRRLHDKFVDMAEHQVRPLVIQNTMPGKSSKAEVKKCLIHQDQELCLFCKACDVSICLVCKLTSHQPHETEDMAVAALRTKEELRALVKTAKEQVQMMEKLLVRLSQDVGEFSRQEEEVKHHVKGRYDEIIMWAGRAREELLETISSEGKHAVAKLKAEEKSARNIIDTLSRLMAHAALTSSGSMELLLLKNELLAALLTKEQLEGFKKESERKEHRKFLSMKGDSSAVDFEILKAYLGTLSIGESGEARFVSLREQMKTLDGKLAKMETTLAKNETTVNGELEGLSTKIKETETGLEVRIDEIETELEGKVDGVVKRFDTTVAFRAFMQPSDEIIIQQKQIVVLNQIQENIGNAYNANGFFTVPVSGLYSFHAFLHVTVGRFGEKETMGVIGLCAEETVLALALATHGYQLSQICLSTVAHVKEGQQVFLMHLGSRDLKLIPGTKGSACSFSGLLVVAD